MRLSDIFCSAAGFLGLVFLVSCSGESKAVPDLETVPLLFDVSIAEGESTKAGPVTNSIVGTLFPPSGGNWYGIGINVGEYDEAGMAFRPQQSGYRNIRTTLYVTGKTSEENEYDWTYHFDGKDHKSLSVLNGRGVEVYAYHPYVDGGTDLSAIAFESGQYDWMYAFSKIDAVGGGTSCTVPLKFHHAMTCIQVRMKMKYNANIKLTSMTLTDGGGRRLCERGTMNLIDDPDNGLIPGELALSPEGMSDMITISPDESLINTFTDFCIIMPEVKDIYPGDFTLSFRFDGLAAQSVFRLPEEMNVRNSDGTYTRTTVTGFEKGKRYVFQMMLDNNMQFTPIGVFDMDETPVDIEIEI